MARFLGDFLVQEEGATMMEYAVMLALIGAALVASVTTLSTTLSAKFTSVSNTLSGS
jgi:pilus assembly protein Flp/PilA